MEIDYSKHKKVVVIYPHPDDESFGTAGTVVKFREAGVPVTYLCGTLGEMGRNMGSPFFANRETLPEIRKQELIKACKEIDMDLQMLGYRDKTMEFEDEQKVADDLRQRIEELDASLVITFYPPHAVHPDHNAMGRAAFRAIRDMDAEKRPEVWANAISNGHEEILGSPDIVVDTKTVFQKKLNALKAHKSQIDGMLQKVRKGNEELSEFDLALRHFRYETYHTVNFNE